MENFFNQGVQEPEVKYISSEFKEWLEVNGFFTVPASANHHGNYYGGLYDHSYAVAETLEKLTNDNGLKWEHERSPYIVGMFHDLCKIDRYVTKDGIYWEHNDDYLIDGHGDKSVIYLAEHMQLTREEILCIRWHMGAFDEKENWKYYSAAVRKYPNVLWTHTADMIASQIMSV